METIMNQIHDPVAAGTWREFESLRREEQAAEQAKQDIAARGASQSQNVVAASLTAAAGGAQMMMELQTAMDTNQKAKQVSELQSGQFASRTAGLQGDMEGLRASIRDLGVRFNTVEEIGAFADAINASRIAESQNRRVLEFLYGRLAERRGDPFRQRIRGSSIGATIAPGNLNFDLSLDFSDRP